MNKYPLIIFTVIFICGIVLKNYFEIDITVTFYAWAFMLTITFILFFIKFNSDFLNILLAINILIAGYLYSALITPNRTNYPFDKQRYNDARIIGKINNIELLREGKIVFEIKTDSILTNEFNTGENILLLCSIYEKNKLKLQNVFDRLTIGSKVAVEGSLRKGKEERNPGEFDYQKYLEENGISGLIYCYKITDFKIIETGESILKNLVFNIRKSIDKQIKKYSNENTASLLRGLILADRSEIDYEIRENFVNAGVIHVLAVSGLHVGFIVLIFVFLFNRLNIVLRYSLTIIGLSAFLIITGSPPSVFRATVMAVVLILSFLTNRSYNSINAISLAALIILLLNPHQLFNPGFQLSFSAVISILLIYPVFQNKINKYKIKNKIINYLLLFAAVSIAAQIGTLPFTLIYFKKISIIALFANLIVIPVIGFIVGIGIFTLIVSLFWNWLAFIYAAANDKLVELLFNFVKWSGSLDFSYLLLPGFSIYDTFLFYLLVLVVFFYYQKFVSQRNKMLFILLIIINYSLYSSFDNKSLMPDNKLSIIFIDVGQGDGILIKFPDGETALIDAGNATPNFDSGERIIKPLFQNMGIDKIDYGFITHLDADHYGGYISLINDGFIKNIYKSELDTALDKDIKFERFIREKELSVAYYKKQILKIGNSRLYILNDTSSYNYNSLNINDKSGIFKLVYGNTSFLFTGDAGIRAEKLILNEYNSFLDSDVLKLGHHGSKTSSSESFLNAVTPEYGIISAGIDNRYKHPSGEVLDRLDDMKIKVKRTDLECAIIVESDGNNIEFIDWKNN